MNGKVKDVVLGGGPFNLCRHLARIGDNPLMVSRVGADEAGQSVIESMRERCMDIRAIQVDDKKKTGTVVVTGTDTFDIPEDQAWDWIEPVDVSKGTLLYSGSLALRNERSRESFAKMQAEVDGPLFVDINLRRPWWSEDRCRWLIDLADYLKINDEEMALLFPGQRLEEIRVQNDLKGVVLTKGKDGLELVTAQGTFTANSPVPVDSIVDTVGAGDSVSAMMIHAILHGWDWDRAVHEAAALAANVCQVRGAEIGVGV